VTSDEWLESEAKRQAELDLEAKKAEEAQQKIFAEKAEKIKKYFLDNIKFGNPWKYSNSFEIACDRNEVIKIVCKWLDENNWRYNSFPVMVLEGDFPGARYHRLCVLKPVRVVG